MKHTAQAFAQAEFARHRDGTKAMRREGVSTDQPWLYLVGNAHHRRSDQEMADGGGWEPVQTVDPEPVVEQIRDPHDLEVFRERHNLRPDWHEPDEQGIGARIIGRHLDNAMGSTTRHEHAEWGGEFNVVLTFVEYNEESNEAPPRDLAVVNLATLLSWAAQYGKVQEDDKA